MTQAHGWQSVPRTAREVMRAYEAGLQRPVTNEVTMQQRTIFVPAAQDTLDNGATVLAVKGRGHKHRDDVGRFWTVLAETVNGVFVVWAFNASDGSCSNGRYSNEFTEATQAFHDAR